MRESIMHEVRTHVISNAIRHAIGHIGGGVGVCVGSRAFHIMNGHARLHTVVTATSVVVWAMMLEEFANPEKK